MLIPNTYLYHLSTDMLPPDILLPDNCPLLLHDLSLDEYHPLVMLLLDTGSWYTTCLRLWLDLSPEHSSLAW